MTTSNDHDTMPETVKETPVRKPKYPRFRYIRDEKRNPIGCVAYQVVRWYNVPGIRLEFGVSFCSSKEKKFDRNVARQIAEGRLKQIPNSLRPPTADSYYMNDAIMKELYLLLLNQNAVPGKTRKKILEDAVAFYNQNQRLPSSRVKTEK